MFELADKILTALAPYPLIEAAGAILLLVIVGPIIMRRAEMDRKSNSGSNINTPAYLLMSPVSDVFGAVHDMAEEFRKNNTMTTDICKLLSDLNRGQSYTHDLLEELIRSHTMTDTTAHPPRPRRPK